MKTTPAEISLKQTPKTSILPRQTPRALELDFPFQINTTVNHSQKPPSSLLSLESESVSIEMTVKPTTITETLKQQKSKSLPLRPSLQAYEVPIYLLLNYLFYFKMFILLLLFYFRLCCLLVP